MPQLFYVGSSTNVPCKQTFCNSSFTKAADANRELRVEVRDKAKNIATAVNRPLHYSRWSLNESHEAG